MRYSERRTIATRRSICETITSAKLRRPQSRNPTRPRFDA